MAVNCPKIVIIIHAGDHREMGVGGSSPGRREKFRLSSSCLKGCHGGVANLFLPQKAITNVDESENSTSPGENPFKGFIQNHLFSSQDSL
jgi:hypothetical protein